MVRRHVGAGRSAPPSARPRAAPTCAPPRRRSARSATSARPRRSSSRTAPAAATRWLHAIAGGYSIVNVRLIDDRISVLTGSIPGHPSGLDLLRAFAAEHPWIGERIFGGARAIPLGPAYDCVAAGNVALLGDAAVQVFSAHGSGIGAGMVAARMLVDALVAGRGVHGYAVAWQRRFGGLHAGYDLFRRFSERLDAGALEQMITSGLLAEATVRAGLEQRWPSVAPANLLPMALGVLREPRLAASLAPVLLRMPVLGVHYARYPREARRLAG